MKILICEDAEILLSAIELRLRKKGFELKLAPSGKIAMDVVQQSPPDLIVADLDMKDVSGLQFIHYVRQELQLGLPILVIGNLEDEQDLLKAMQEGANDFLTKPFKPTELALRIQNILRRNQA